MCGIMGYYAFGKVIPDKEKITNMFSLLETRGRDSAGFCFLDKENLKVVKAPITSSELVKTKEWESLTLPKIMIFHARAKTQGTQTNNMNNHPLFNKNGMAIVHNGMILNDKEIFGKNQKRDAEVDSEAILALLSSKKNNEKLETRIKRVFDRLEGGFAVASINKEDPERLLLIRKDNPLELYYNHKDDILYFCSEREIMQEALSIKKKQKRGFTLGEDYYHNYGMENNHSLIINKDGVESYKKYYPKRNQWTYKSKDICSFDLDHSLVECPYCLDMVPYYWERLFNRCENCGQPLQEEDVYV